MSNEVERKVGLSANKTARGTQAKDRAEAVSERPRRSRVAGGRDKLTVSGQDPAFQYRWVKDVGNSVEKPDGSLHLKPGQRILSFQESGWSFVKSGEVGDIGESHVYSTKNQGDIIRLAAGMDEYLFLMKIKKEWYEEDQAAKEEEIKEMEQARTLANSAEGQYGSSLDISYG